MKILILCIYAFSDCSGDKVIYLFIYILNVEVDICNWLGFYSLHVHLIKNAILSHMKILVMMPAVRHIKFRFLL